MAKKLDPLFLGYLKHREEGQMIKRLKAKPAHSKLSKKHKAADVIEAERN